MLTSISVKPLATFQSVSWKTCSSGSRCSPFTRLRSSTIILARLPAPPRASSAASAMSSVSGLPERRTSANASLNPRPGLAGVLVASTAMVLAVFTSSSQDIQKPLGDSCLTGIPHIPLQMTRPGNTSLTLHRRNYSDGRVCCTQQMLQPVRLRPATVVSAALDSSIASLPRPLPELAVWQPAEPESSG